MRCVPRADVAAGAWDALCDASADAWLFHRHAWVAIECEVSGAADHGFALVDARDTVAGVLPLYAQELALGPFRERLLHSGLHRHTGLALRDDLAPADAAAARSLALGRTLELAGTLGTDRIQLNVQNLAPAWRDREREEIPFWVLDHGFELGLHTGPQGLVPVPGMSTLAADQIVRLREHTSEELFARLESACRRAVRKATRSGLRARDVAAAGAVPAYYALAERSAKRTGEALPPRDHYDRVSALDGSGDVAVRILFAELHGRDVGALLLLAHKGAVHFLAGVSDPEYLDVRVNDFLHWSAIEWARAAGHDCYRLGPVFPELPRDWPVARVSRFKKKLGGDSLPVLQGSLFLRPERYAELGRRALEEHTARRGPSVAAPRAVAAAAEPLEVVLDRRRALDLATMLRAVGAVDLPLRVRDEPGDGAGAQVVFAYREGAPLPPGVRAEARAPGAVYADVRRRGAPAYRPLLDHRVFRGDGLEPVWADAGGAALLARWQRDGRTRLLVGVDAVEEVIRYRQGDPRRDGDDVQRSRYGFDFERPNHLFEHQLDPQRPAEPWADRLLYELAEQLAALCACPLVEPLPGGARGLVLLTGDDDQAELATYARQQRVLRGTPITYYLLPHTNHRAETLARLGAHVEFGVHVDALEAPDDYARICPEQTRAVRTLSGGACRSVRNHGFLHGGYLGQLDAWEESGLLLDVNLPGVDGTALNASFLPMRLRRPDGRWAGHWTLLTAFGDGMVFALSLGQGAAVRRVRALARAIEASRPGVLVFNLHPQNVARTLRLHRAVRRLAGRPGWRALGAESYLDWLLALDALRIRHGRGRITLRCPQPLDPLVLRWPTPAGWRRLELGPVSGEREVALA